jgi:hypothetical protein
LILYADRAPAADAAAPAPVVYWSEAREAPRPLHICFLRVDLKSSDCEIFALLGRDPDGDGQAEAALESPVQMAREHAALAAVNANGFQSLPDANGKRDTDWFAGKPVDLVGLAAADGAVRSATATNHAAFWIGSDGKARIGIPGEDDQLRQGVSDWSGVLVSNGCDVAATTTNLHPRTLLGLDRSRRWLLAVVVDGRRPGYSEGVTLREASAIMLEHGCREAISLDGGGSSIMLIADPPGWEPEIMNYPAGSSPRPIPVMLGVRRRPPAVGRKQETAADALP